jgi:hypothetical protein
VAYFLKVTIVKPQKEPLLANGSYIYFKIRAAKHTTEQHPVLGNRFLIMQQLDYNNGELCFLRGPCREVISETSFRSQSDTVWRRG